MSAKKVFFGLIAGSLLLCGLIISTAVLGNMVFKKQFEKLTELKAQNQALEQQSISLIKAKQDVEKYNELNEITKDIVPQDKDQARTVREINKIAQESGIRLNSLSFEPSTLGDKRPSNNPEESTPKQAATSSKALTQVQPVAGIPGVYSLGIIIQTDENDPVTYEQFLTFLEKLESNRRTAHVGRISIEPDEGGANVTFTLTLNAFVRDQ
jgi:hypothetical protein